jgi:hypothetical protein
METDGRIIALVPKRPYTIRLTDEAQQALEEVQSLVGHDNSSAFDLAIRHLRGTLQRELPLRLKPMDGHAAEEKAS